MLHFAYPNINERERRFLGCGRYIALSADDVPVEHDYEPAAPKVITLTTKVYTAASLLSPESSASMRKIYERKDQPDEKYFGNSQNLAYLLALISRSRAWRFSEIPGDVWCTGSIDLGADKQPFLEAVQASGFELKLQAFLEDAQPDRLFIAPEPNLQAVDDRLLCHPSLRVVSLPEFQQLSPSDFADHKTILKVFPTELNIFCNELFAPSADLYAASVSPTAALNPYRGLFAFREQDAEFFFGRTAFIAQLLQKMQHNALVSIIGASGSGKSSLLFAGLLPRLRAQQHLVIAARPGNDPFRAVAAALVPILCHEKSDVERLLEINAISERLKRAELSLVDVFEATQRVMPEQSLLVVLDQVEELYTLCRDDALRRRFLEALIELETGFSTARIRGNLLLALRADFLGKAVSFAPFAAHFQRSGLILAPMDAHELREVIEAPAAKCGVDIEDGLTDRILQTISDEPGSLPLLQFALTQLWEHRQGQTLTHAAYNAIGGVEHALAAYAEQVYHALTPDEQGRAQHIFTQLVRPGEGTEDTRRLASSTEIGEENWAVAVKLADARLVVTSQKALAVSSEVTSSSPDSTLELVHEALISGWQRLREWLDTDREFRMWQERLRVALRQWKAHEGDQSALLRGLPLAEAELWMMKRLHQFGAEELRFITASLRAHHKLRWQRRVGRFALTGLIGFAIFLFVLMRNDVALQHRIADINQMNALLQSSRARFLSHNELASLLSGLKVGVMANRLNPPPFLRFQIVLNLREIVDTIRERHRLEGHSLAIECLAISPDGGFAVSGSHDRLVNVWHLPDGHLQYTLRGHRSGVRAAAISPDSRIIATGGADRMIRLWNFADGALLKTLFGHIGEVRSLDFSPDGKRLLSAGADGTILIWDVERGANTHILAGHASTVTVARYSKDSTKILSASEDATMRLWDAVSGEEIATLRGHVGPVWDMALHPDGTMIATCGEDRTIKLWNLQTLTEMMILRGHTDAVRSVAFSPDGALLASGSDEFDCTIRLWDVSEGKELEQWKGHYNSVGQLCFTPDGTMLLSGSDDHAIKLWQRHTPREAYALPSQHLFVKSIAFHPQRPLLASGNADGTITLWDMIDHRELHTLKGHRSVVRSITFSPDGKLLASASHDMSIKLWNLDTLTEVSTLTGHHQIIRSVNFSPEGTLLASGSEDHTINIWNAATGELLRTLYGHQDRVTAVEFSPNGKWLASASEDSSVRLWDAITWRELRVFSGHQVAVRALAFSPDSRILASGSGDNTIKLWDAATGKELRTLKGHARTLTSLAFIQKGTALLSGSQDHTLKIWDVERGEEFATLRGHAGQINSVASSPTRPLFASASDDQTIQLWDVELDHLLKRSCEWLKDYLATNPNISEADRKMCQGILTAAE